MNKPIASCALAQLAKYPISHVLGVSKYCFPSTWVLDSGAIDHMTFSSHCFSSYNPCSGDKKKIKVGHGTLATVEGQGKIALTLTITLKYLLHIPKLSANLLSIHQISKDLNCTVTLFPSHCVV